MLCGVSRQLRLLALATLAAAPIASMAQQPSLTLLVSHAVARHPSPAGLAKTLAAQSLQVEGARWQFWPTPSISLEAVDTKDPTYRGERSVSTLRLNQPLWSGGRLEANLARAEAQLSKAAADLDAARQEIALRTLQAWVEAAGAHKKLAAYQRGADAHTRLLALVQRRTTEGLSAAVDVGLAQSRLQGLEAEILATQGQREAAITKLSILTGDSTSLIEAAISAVVTPPRATPGAASLVDQAQKVSPEIRRADAQIAIAQADIDLAKAALLPEVYARAERQYGNYSTPTPGPQDRIFLGLTATFGPGASHREEVSASIARKGAAQADLETQKMALEEQVRADASIYANAKRRQDSLQGLLVSNAAIADSWERQFLAGRKQWLDLMNAAREKIQTEIQLADALASELLSGWRLAIRSGGLDKFLSATGPRQ